jgi:DNA helicase II / ATP-dependent DNA helicase PcrA
MDEPPRPHAWWRAHGPWRVALEGPPEGGWRPAWGALLAGGEPTMPLDGHGQDPAPTAWRPPRRRHALLASVEAALAWAHEALDGAPPGWSVTVRSPAAGAAGERLRWRALSVDDLRAAAREIASWTSEPPAATATPAVGPGPPTLTAAQRTVVAHDDGPAVVVAVAGAGKTTTMVARVRQRIARGRIDPRRLLVVSFSRAAIAAVRAQLRGDPALEGVEVRTFHSLAHLLLVTRARLGAPTPAKGPPPAALVAQVARRARRAATAADPDLADAWRDVDLTAFAAYRGRCLARLELPALDDGLPTSARVDARPPPPDPDHPDHPALLEHFERVRRGLGWLDHDQLLVEAWAALHAHADLLAWARARWRAAIVDEAQDVNAVQLATLELLMAGRDDVMLVGDDDQSVYGFRGSVPGSLRGFALRHRATVLLLPEAFRSRAEPLAAAAALMAHGGGRWPVRPRAVRGAGGRLTLDLADGAEAEAARLLARARAHRDRGTPWSQQAVLLRRFAQATALELVAARSGIPLRLEGAPPLARQPAVVAAWAGVALALGAAGETPAARERAWRRWLAGPGGLPQPAAWAAAVPLSRHPGVGADAWHEAAPRGSDPEPGARLGAIAALAGSDAAAALLAAGIDPRAWPANPPPALTAAAALVREAGLREARGRDGPTHGVAALAAARASWRRPAPRDALLVTSVHRAKGLEWPVVHVPGMNAGSFPLGDDPEERRLAYVAWTRAREALHLYRDARAPPSPFLEQGEVTRIAALARDGAWLAARPQDGATLAARWYRREARRRFGAEGRGYDVATAPPAGERARAQEDPVAPHRP